MVIDIHRRKYASQGKKVKEENKSIFGQINKNIYGWQGNEGQSAYANQTPFFRPW